MLEILEQVLIEQKCAIRMNAPQDVSKFAIVAVAGNGVPLAVGLGETLEEAAHEMLVDFGILPKEETCTATT